METQKTSWRKLTREQRGQLIYKTLTITPTPRGWRVPSQTNSKRSYFVKFNGHRTYCDCPDCEIRKQKCKHIHAVEFFIKTKGQGLDSFRRSKGENAKGMGKINKNNQ